jgi:hypothetical protein
MARTANADRAVDEAQSLAHGNMSEALELADELRHVLDQIYRREPRLLRFTDYGKRLLAELVLVLNHEQQVLKRSLDEGQQQRHEQHFGRGNDDQPDRD